MIGIYKITNPKGTVYIGQSIDIMRRFKDYTKIRNSKSQTLLNRSFIKYGIENHQFNIICECNIEDLNSLERRYQDLYNSMVKGLNCRLTRCNDLSGKMSEETKVKIGISNKGKIKPQSQIDYLKNRTSPMLGKNHNAVTISLMRNSAIKRGCTEEQKLRLSLLNKGKKHSKEIKLKMSLGRIGKNTGLENKRSVILIDENTGVFYYSINEASFYSDFKEGYMRKMVLGVKNNTTSIRIA